MNVTVIIVLPHVYNHVSYSRQKENLNIFNDEETNRYNFCYLKVDTYLKYYLLFHVVNLLMYRINVIRAFTTHSTDILKEEVINPVDFFMFELNM